MLNAIRDVEPPQLLLVHPHGDFPPQVVLVLLFDDVRVGSSTDISEAVDPRNERKTHRTAAVHTNELMDVQLLTTKALEALRERRESILTHAEHPKAHSGDLEWLLAGDRRLAPRHSKVSFVTFPCVARDVELDLLAGLGIEEPDAAWRPSTHERLPVRMDPRHAPLTKHLRAPVGVEVIRPAGHRIVHQWAGVDVVRVRIGLQEAQQRLQADLPTVSREHDMAVHDQHEPATRLIEYLSPRVGRAVNVWHPDVLHWRW